jgi:hypothetical protein
MNGETRSFTVRVQRAHHPDTTRLQVLRVDTAEEVHFSSTTFLLRVTIDKGGVVERCFVRHVASGREAFVQGGPGLSAFVQDCLLERAEPASPEEIGG